MKYGSLLPVFVGCILSVTLPWGCSATSERDSTVRIGSKNFTEQFILTELIAQLIEENTDIKVKRVLNLGGTMICHNALVNGEIDMYPEYTGTALTAILGQAPINDAQQTLILVTKEYRDKFQLEWQPPFGFNNTYTLTVRRADAVRHNWQSISDLRSAAPSLTAGFTAEFAERADGYPGLQKAYGFKFSTSYDMDPGLMYKTIADGSVDVICAFSTDGRIKAYDLQPLTDDKGYFPPYYAAPVVRRETLAKYPEIKIVLEKLAGVIDDKTMQILNYAVDEEKQSPHKVARKFLERKELIKQE